MLSVSTPLGCMFSFLSLSLFSQTLALLQALCDFCYISRCFLCLPQAKRNMPAQLIFHVQAIPLVFTPSSGIWRFAVAVMGMFTIGSFLAAPICELPLSHPCSSNHDLVSIVSGGNDETVGPRQSVEGVDV